ncbi:hypothetical protein [Salibaculum griseiflavum]|nr:hypothetical protein [Salibaculum griseiflavum]
MDGQPICDRRQAEALRQQQVFERAMTELEMEKRRKLAGGYAVMAAAYTFEPAITKNGWLAKSVKLSKLLLVTIVGVIPNYYVAMQLLN